MAHVVITRSCRETPRVGQIFSGISFFVQRKVPTRTQLVNDIEANGGRVLKLERGADYHIADHLRPDAPSGSYSYTLIETAIKNGAMPGGEELELHATGARSTARRPVESAMTAKSTRTAFSSHDDRILWEWVKRAEANGQSATGLAMYKPLAEAHPHHTIQSWRDRYVKRLMGGPPPAPLPVVSANPPPSPPVTAADQAEAERTLSPRKRRKTSSTTMHTEAGRDLGSLGDFDPADVDRLLADADDIEAISKDRYGEAWAAWHLAHPYHTADEWKDFYELRVKPIYLEQRAAKNREEARLREVHSTHRGEQDVDKALQTESEEALEPAPSQLNAPETGLPSVLAHEAELEEEIGVQTRAQNKSGRSADQTSADFEISSPAANKAGEDRTHQQFASIDPVHRQNALQTRKASREFSNATPVLEDQLPHAVSEGLENPEDMISMTGNVSEAQNQDEVDDNLASEHGRLALTRANLANQQQATKTRSTRGTDIAEDEPQYDQSDFINYLQNLMEPGAESQTFSVEDQGHVQLLASNSSTLNHSSEAHKRPTRALSLASDEEVNDIVESNLNWPGSPEQSMQQHADQADKGDLPHTQARAANSSNEARPPGPFSSMSGSHSSTMNTGQKRRAVQDFVDESDSEEEDDEQFDFDMVDLMVPEPDGGFDYTDAPIAAANSTLTAARDNLSIPNIFEDAAPEQRVNVTEAVREAIELSSANPSSSSYHGSQQSQQWDADEVLGNNFVDTQDILNAATQIPDLHMPLPPSSVDDFEDEAIEDHVRDQPRDSNSDVMIPPHEGEVPDGSDEEDAPDVDTWMSKMKHCGFDETSVVSALKCTCLRLDLAHIVLLEEAAGHSFPEDIPGVWSQLDDEWLEGSNAMKIARLREKHGADELDLRLKFLQDLRDEDENEEYGEDGE